MHCRPLLLAAGLMALPQMAAADFPANINLADLNGTNGFKLSGVAAGDFSGLSVSEAGDINGDGIADLIIGAPYASPDGIHSGASYVVFGKDTATAGNFPANLELSSLDGTTGFKLSGMAASDFSGRSVSAAGDINGDGMADLIIGAPGADPNGTAPARATWCSGRTRRRRATSRPTSSSPLSTAPTASSSRGWRPVTLGPLGERGRGHQRRRDGGPNYRGGWRRPERYGSGASYVVFGKDTATAGVPSQPRALRLDGTTGFKLSGVAADDYSGRSVSAAGDINGDDVADLIIGAPPERLRLRRELRGVREGHGDGGGLPGEPRALLSRWHHRLQALGGGNL